MLDAGKVEPLLWQLPPTFARDDQRLAEALDRFPTDLRHAVEFRHESWSGRLGEAQGCLRVLQQRPGGHRAAQRPRPPAIAWELTVSSRRSHATANDAGDSLDFLCRIREAMKRTLVLVLLAALCAVASGCGSSHPALSSGPLTNSTNIPDATYSCRVRAKQSVRESAGACVRDHRTQDRPAIRHESLGPPGRL